MDATLEKEVKTEMERISQRLAQRIKELSGHTLPITEGGR